MTQYLLAIHHARARPDLDRVAGANAGEQRRHARAPRGLVVRAEQVGPRLVAQRREIVLEHRQQTPLCCHWYK